MPYALVGGILFAFGGTLAVAVILHKLLRLDPGAVARVLAGVPTGLSAILILLALSGDDHPGNALLLLLGGLVLFGALGAWMAVATLHYSQRQQAEALQAGPGFTRTLV